MCRIESCLCVTLCERHDLAEDMLDVLVSYGQFKELTTGNDENGGQLYAIHTILPCCDLVIQ